MLVLPYRVAEPAYRQDEHRYDDHYCAYDQQLLTRSSPPEAVKGVTPDILAPALGLPHLVVPCKLPSRSKPISG